MYGCARAGLPPAHPMTQTTPYSPAPKGRPRVAVIYHFFAHYRKAVIERLAQSTRASFIFFGDDHDYESAIKGGRFSSAVDLRPCRTHQIARSFMWQSGLLRVALSRQVDQLILLGNANWPATWLAAIAGRLTGKRVLFWSHGFLTRPSGEKGWIRRIFFRLAHAHLFYGRVAKQHAVDLGWDPARIYVVGNSLDYDTQRAARESVTPAAVAACRAALFREPELPTVVCSCRLVRGKRLDLLIEALRILRVDGLRANMIIIGDGSERASLEQLARDAGVAAHFEGACYDESRIALLTMCAAVTACPGFVGLTAIHSMAYGVPVVTNRRSCDTAPEVEAIIPGQTGDLFDDGDARGLADALRQWLGSRAGDRSVSAACIEMVESWWTPDYQLAVIERAVAGEPAPLDDYPRPEQ